jgi:hypothetical protein
VKRIGISKTNQWKAGFFQDSIIQGENVLPIIYFSMPNSQKLSKWANSQGLYLTKLHSIKFSIWWPGAYEFETCICEDVKGVPRCGLKCNRSFCPHGERKPCCECWIALCYLKSLWTEFKVLTLLSLGTRLVSAHSY